MDCFICNTPTYLTCNACHVVSYCSVDCQSHDWSVNDHKSHCLLIGLGLYDMRYKKKSDTKSKSLYRKYKKLKEASREYISPEMAMFLHMDYIFTKQHEAPWKVSLYGELNTKPHIRKIYRRLKNEYSQFGLGDIDKEMLTKQKITQVFNKIINFVYKKTILKK